MFTKDKYQLPKTIYVQTNHLSLNIFKDYLKPYNSFFSFV